MQFFFHRRSFDCKKNLHSHTLSCNYFYRMKVHCSSLAALMLVGIAALSGAGRNVIGDIPFMLPSPPDLYGKVPRRKKGMGVSLTSPTTRIVFFFRLVGEGDSGGAGSPTPTSLFLPYKPGEARPPLLPTNPQATTSPLSPTDLVSIGKNNK